MSNYKEILKAFNKLDFNTLSLKEKRELLVLLQSQISFLKTDLLFDEALRILKKE